MTESTIAVEIDLLGQFYNHWPRLKIYHNDHIIFDGDVVGQQKLNFDLDCDTQNKLVFVHHGKRFGENNIWDSGPDSSQDCNIKITDIKFNQITIGPDLLGNLVFHTDWTNEQLQTMEKSHLDEYSVIAQSMGMMNFNGKISLEFTLPILNWLTIAKYKTPVNESAYFSNFSLRWHYDEDVKLIQEIKRLINIP